jgi:hypothetical protein
MRTSRSGWSSGGLSAGMTFKEALNDAVRRGLAA